MTSMFYCCINLKKVDLSKWNVEKCLSFKEMFSGCQKLKTPGNLSNWKVNEKADFRSMFENTRKLTGVGPIGEKWLVQDSM